MAFENKIIFFKLHNKHLQATATAIEVAFLLLERITSKNNVENVKRLMGFKSKNSNT